MRTTKLRPDPSREFIQAIEVLGKTVFEIHEMYRIRLLIWWDRDGFSTIELEGEHATVCCVLDEDFLCIESYLFCEDDRDLISYANYQNLIYSNCRIQYLDGKTPCLSFTP